MKAALLVWVALAIVVASAIGINAVQNDGPPDLVVLIIGLIILVALSAVLLRIASSVRTR